MCTCVKVLVTRRQPGGAGVDPLFVRNTELEGHLGEET